MTRLLPCALWIAAAMAAMALPAGSVQAADRYWPPVADPATNEYHPGKWVWAELLTRDVATAAEFYARVFDWTYETYGPSNDLETYTLILAHGTPIGGMIFADPSHPDTPPNARWVGLVSVANVDAAASAASTHGGRVVVRPFDAGVRGRLALLADPEGALFGVIHSATGDPEDYLAEVGEWLWFELWADDAKRMGQFYGDLAGYRVESRDAPDEARGSLHLVEGNLPRAGILAKPARVPTSWVPYVRVADVAATAAAARTAGGAVVIQPMTVHNRKVALLLDPTGAPIAIAEWQTEEGVQ